MRKSTSLLVGLTGSNKRAATVRHCLWEQMASCALRGKPKYVSCRTPPGQNRVRRLRNVSHKLKLYIIPAEAGSCKTSKTRVNIRCSFRPGSVSWWREPRFVHRYTPLSSTSSGCSEMNPVGNIDVLSCPSWTSPRLRPHPESHRR